MQHSRKPAVAGLFYPADPNELARSIRDLLPAPRAGADAPKAVIAPHAGYRYSGAVAAAAHAELARDSANVRCIALLGPAHRVAFTGLALQSAERFETPLGSVPVDTARYEALRRLPQVRSLDAAHDIEHGLEVQLPFLQVLLTDFSIVPLLVGDASTEEVAEVVECLWDGAGTRFVISSDLSHYHDYDTARRLDAATARAILALEPDALGAGDVCGRNPIRGWLAAARAHGLAGELLDLRSSGDTAGRRDRVVGYGAFAFH